MKKCVNPFLPAFLSRTASVKILSVTPCFVERIIDNMKVHIPIRLLLTLVAVMLLAPAADLRAQDARTTLTNLPDSNAVLYINARRLINEAAPSFVPPEVLNKALADAKQFIDLNGLEYVIASARLKGEPSAKQLPEFLLIVRGSFSAEALLSGARMMGQGMYAQETHGAKMIDVFTLNKPAQPGAEQPGDGGKPAQKFPIDQIAATALDANTLAIGIPSYIRDAIDASGGGGQQSRLKPELVDLALRDTNTVVSLVAEMPASASQYVRAFGAPPNAEMERMLDAVRQVQLSWGMIPSAFGVQSIIRMDGSEQAQALSGLVNIGAGFVKGEITKDLQKKSGGEREDMAALLRVLETLTNATRDNEVVLGLTFQQAEWAEIIKRQMAPKKQVNALAPPAPAAKKVAPRRSRGRARRR